MGFAQYFFLESQVIQNHHIIALNAAFGEEQEERCRIHTKRGTKLQKTEKEKEKKKQTIHPSAVIILRIRCLHHYKIV